MFFKKIKIACILDLIILLFNFRGFIMKKYAIYTLPFLLLGCTSYNIDSMNEAYPSYDLQQVKPGGPFQMDATFAYINNVNLEQNNLKLYDIHHRYTMGSLDKTRMIIDTQNNTIVSTLASSDNTFNSNEDCIKYLNTLHGVGSIQNKDNQILFIKQNDKLKMYYESFSCLSIVPDRWHLTYMATFPEYLEQFQKMVYFKY